MVPEYLHEVTSLPELLAHRLGIHLTNVGVICVSQEAAQSHRASVLPAVRAVALLHRGVAVVPALQSNLSIIQMK